MLVCSLALKVGVLRDEKDLNTSAKFFVLVIQQPFLTSAMLLFPSLRILIQYLEIPALTCALVPACVLASKNSARCRAWINVIRL